MVMAAYGKHVSRKTTPQIDAASPRQVQNNAGGYVFEGDSELAFRRFLILGSQGGTYYVTEKALTRQAATAVETCLRRSPEASVSEIVAVSEGGRAPSNTPCVFALALAASLDDPECRRLALAALPRVCRIPTHLFQFVAFCEELRGWGRGLRRAVGQWYTDLPLEKLAYEVVKYQQREGWSNRDLLRLAHPSPKGDPARSAIFKWITQGPGKMGIEEIAGLPPLITAFEAAKVAKGDVITLIRDHGLTREMIPSECLQDPKVWEALLDKMPLTAMIRNLGKMSQVGLLTPLSAGVNTVVGRLADTDYLRKSRIHPLALLLALKTYARGGGIKGSLTWDPVGRVIDALNDAFYASFGMVEPTGKRILLACDVSGSMAVPLTGAPMLTCREAVACLALLTAKVEKEWAIVGFTSARATRYGGGTAITPLAVTPSQRLDDVTRYMANLPFGGTDCALPWIWLREKGLAADAVITLTDNETWAGASHPFQEMKRYRSQTGIQTKSIVVGMTATDFTINDPTDPLGLDVVGFDTKTPSVMNDFIVGPPTMTFRRVE